jgi:hypothetical protein
MGAEWQKKAASQHGLFWVAGRDVTRKSCRQGQAAIFGITCFGSRSVHSVTSLSLSSGRKQILYRAARRSCAGGILQASLLSEPRRWADSFSPAAQTRSKLAFGHCAGVGLDCFRLDSKDCELRRLIHTPRFAQTFNRRGPTTKSRIEKNSHFLAFPHRSFDIDQLWLAATGSYSLVRLPHGTISWRASLSDDCDDPE